jgi:KUP system potassium uptake protein
MRRLSIMTFWTWAKGLEDKFDGANRRNLRRFIVARDDDSKHASAVDLNVGAVATLVNGDDSTDGVDDTETVAYDYFASKAEKDVEERKELVRIDTCAVFYKLSSGTGVPHSFVGFIRQWPALPRVVVRLSSSR